MLKLSYNSIIINSNDVHVWYLKQVWVTLLHIKLNLSNLSY